MLDLALYAGEHQQAGIYVCGAFQGPKDIPQSVMEASAAAAAAGELLGAARGTELKTANCRRRRDVAGQEPRVGVFVCNCGINIGGVINVPALTEYVATLPGVALADQNLFTCSTDTQGKILRPSSRKTSSTGWWWPPAAPGPTCPCSRRPFEEAGLNPYLFEMANIRDQDSWVHMHEPEKALEKAKDLIRVAVARVVHAGTLAQTVLPGNQSRPGHRRRGRRHGSGPVHRRHGLSGLPGGKGR